MYEDAAHKFSFFFSFRRTGLAIYHETAHTQGTFTDSFIVAQTAGYMICHSLAKL